MLGLNAFIVNQILIALNEQSGLMYSLNNHIVSIDNIMLIRGHVQHVRKLDTWKANIHEFE